MTCSGIICFGDSNTYGFDPRSYLGDRYEEEYRWCDILKKELSCKVINLGQNGRAVPEGDCSLLERKIIENKDCDSLIIMLGSNDIAMGLQPDIICGKMERLIISLKNIREMRIILISPPEIKGYENFSRRLEELSERYALLAARLGCLFCDAGKWELDLCFDGIHLTEQGHQSFAEKLIKFIKEN